MPPIIFKLDRRIGNNLRKGVPPFLMRAPLTPATYQIGGVTKSSSGAVLGSCTVKLYRTSDDLLIGTTTSDANGNYSFQITGLTSTTYYVVAYKAGSPDVMGTTLNTLLGT